MDRVVSKTRDRLEPGEWIVRDDVAAQVRVVGVQWIVLVTQDMEAIVLPRWTGEREVLL